MAWGPHRFGLGSEFVRRKAISTDNTRREPRRVETRFTAKGLKYAIEVEFPEIERSRDSCDKVIFTFDLLTVTLVVQPTQSQRGQGWLTHAPPPPDSRSG